MRQSAAGRAREWVRIYTRDLSPEDLQRLFTHDTRDAYEFFARLGDLILTGPTSTNVGDLQVVLVGA